MLNSRMSSCASRRCSSNIHAEWGRPSGFTPRSFSGMSFTTSSNLACAPPPLSRYMRCSRSCVSEFFPAGLVLLVFIGLSFIDWPFFFHLKLNDPQPDFRLIEQIVFRFHAAKHAPNAAHNAAHGKDSLIVAEKNFTGAPAAVVPALEERKMLHGF